MAAFNLANELTCIRYHVLSPLSQHRTHFGESRDRTILVDEPCSTDQSSLPYRFVQVLCNWSASQLLLPHLLSNFANRKRVLCKVFALEIGNLS